MAFAGLTPAQIANLTHTPALDPPPDTTPNFVNPESIVPQAIVVAVLGVVITTSCVVIRLYTRQYIVRSLWWDDLCSFIAWLGLIAITITGLYMTRYKAGIHQWNQNYADYIQMNYIRYIADGMYFAALLPTKLSILFQYLRIFVPSRHYDKFMYYSIHLLIWANVFFCVINFFLFLFECTPRAASWDPFVDNGGSCLNPLDFVVSAIFNIAFDCAILILPIRRVWRLQLTVQRKFGISMIFGVGAFACITSAMRLYYTYLLVVTGDEAYLNIIVGAWIFGEVSVGIICGCLPSISRFIRHVKPFRRYEILYIPFRASKRYFDSRSSESSSGPSLRKSSYKVELNGVSQFGKTMGTLSHPESDV